MRCGSLKAFFHDLCREWKLPLQKASIEGIIGRDLFDEKAFLAILVSLHRIIGIGRLVFLSGFMASSQRTPSMQVGSRRGFLRSPPYRKQPFSMVCTHMKAGIERHEPRHAVFMAAFSILQTVHP